VSDTLPGTTRWDERHRAREVALRVLYQVMIGHVPFADAMHLVEQPEDSEAVALDAAARAFAATLAAGAWGARDDLDAVIAPHLLNWRLERIAAIDRIVLWLAIQEWLSAPSTPPRVVLSEALELAREYSGDAAVKFVNGVLDAVYRRLKQEGRIID